MIAGSERGGGLSPDDGLLWDIATPAEPTAVPGVSMAGFDDRGITPSALRLIPHPAVTLIMVFDGTIAVEDAAGSVHQGGFAIGPGYGQALRALRVDGFSCVQIRLSPMAAHAVLGGVVGDLDTVVPVAALLGRESERLTERLGGQASWRRRFLLLQEWLGDRLTSATPAASEINWAWRQIAARRGSVRIEQLAEDLGWSRRQFWSRFRSQVGLPPKRAAKLVRFDHAVHRLAAGAAPAQVAADGGYTDQSHLHRDVAAFTGLTPVTVSDEPFLAVDHVAWGWPPGERAGSRRGGTLSPQW